MIKTTILVPVTDNEGQPFPDTERRWLLQTAVRRFGGVTVEGTADGQWKDQRRVVHDVSLRVTIALASWRDIPRWLRFVKAVRLRFRQKEIYGEVAGIPELFSG